MVYKSAILGCGPRAAEHIKVYEGLKEIHLHAACDKNKARLDDYGKKFRISALYESFEEMLDKERPDILHIVTPPTIREEPIELAAQYGVKGIIVEKPIALKLKQIEQIKKSVNKSGLKIAVNMQRRYFKTCQELKKCLDKGTIGDIQFIRCVTKGNILSMGPHLIDLLLFFLQDTDPLEVWACAYGMNGYDYGHPAPANMLINLTFPGDISVYCEDAEDAIGTAGEQNFWQHLEFNFWGTKGRAWWTQNRDWGYQCDETSNAYIEKSRWDESSIPGQREFTRALAHWLDDDRKTHLNCLDNALKGFDLIMGALQSAYTGRRIEFPANIPENIMEKLEERLK